MALKKSDVIDAAFADRAIRAIEELNSRGSIESIHRVPVALLKILDERVSECQMTTCMCGAVGIYISR